MSIEKFIEGASKGFDEFIEVAKGMILRQENRHRFLPHFRLVAFIKKFKFIKI